MKRNTPYSTHIGAASILLIFMVLSLVSFAALAMINSRADYILSQKLLVKSNAFYSACHEGNGYVASIDKALRGIHASTQNEKEYLTLAGELELEKSIPINETQNLEIAIAPLFPQKSYDPYFRITKWQVVTHLEGIELDENLPVLK
ncbi:hypothetical protein [Butyrivibrio sp. NC2002]|uniref:hypothetical protein n=1 Tax=Butyrivibrio sp. NC2002 TaxID=1410610 RepID=UPI0005685630|nr:hypothetical protein [Butyrivibrio sp. NC2002]